MTTEAYDKRQAAQAYAKLSRGEQLSVREQSSLKRFEKDREEELRWKFYASIPQKHWRTMSGRQTKVINEQATRYGLPFGGAIINLTELARAIHDFLAANAHKLAVDDPLLQGASSPALEEYRRERTALARLERLERERHLLPRDGVRLALGRIAALLRGAGDTLQRQFGDEALDILLEALADAELQIDSEFGDVPPEELDDGNAPSTGRWPSLAVEAGASGPQALDA
jgi:hypothetical protein